MLKIHHNLLPHLPDFSHAVHVMELSPVTSEGDELIRAIEEEHNKGNWQLDPTDAESLESFWSGVEEDIHNDPEWISFEEDEPEG